MGTLLSPDERFNVAMSLVGRGAGRYADILEVIQVSAEAQLKKVMDAFPSNDEIRLRVIDVQFGGLSVPDFVEWLKAKFS